MDIEYKKVLENILNVPDKFAYFNELKRFVALLNNGHSDVYYPNYIYNDDCFGYLPIKIKYINGDYYISNFLKDYNGKIKLFSKIIRINNIPTDKYLDEFIHPYCWNTTKGAKYQVISYLRFGRITDKFKFSLEFNGEVYDCKIKRVPSKTITSDCWFTRDKWVKTLQELNHLYIAKEEGFQILEKGNIGVLRVLSFESEDMVKAIFERRHLLKDKDYLIIDLRRNGGGNSTYSYDFLSMFVNKPFKTSLELQRIHYPAYKGSVSYLSSNLNIKDYPEYVKRFGENSDAEKYFAVLNDRYYEEKYWGEWYNKDFGNIFTQPVFVLIGSNTASASENFLIALKALGRGIICGENSVGTTGQPLYIKLPYEAMARICTRQCLHLDGSDFDNIGITPDIIIEETLEDYLEYDEYIEDKVFSKVYSIINN